MHIPDGFLSAPVAVAYAAASFLGVAAACHRQRNREGRAEGSSALLGVSAAFIFAAQLVNFPVAAGASGHLVGGALLGALVGLPSAVIAMTSVLIVQCLVFGDGGMLSLGANVFNMAIVNCVVAVCSYRLLCGARPSPTRRVAAAAFGAFVATLITAGSCAEQLALSGAAALAVVLPAMLSVHVLIALGEALITALVLSSVLRLRPELLETAPSAHSTPPRRVRSVAGYGLGLALAVAALLAPIASKVPDGLSSVAQRLGFSDAPHASHLAFLAHYGAPSLASGLVASVLAGSLGCILLFGLCWLLARALVPRTRSSNQTEPVVDGAGPPLRAR